MSWKNILDVSSMLFKINCLVLSKLKYFERKKRFYKYVIISKAVPQTETHPGEYILETEGYKSQCIFRQHGITIDTQYKSAKKMTDTRHPGP